MTTAKIPTTIDLSRSGDAWEHLLSDLVAHSRQVDALRMSDALATIESMWASESDCAWLEAPTMRVSETFVLGAAA
jgi:hypothetical protein